MKHIEWSLLIISLYGHFNNDNNYNIIQITRRLHSLPQDLIIVKTDMSVLD